MFWWPIGGWEFSSDVLPVVARGWWNAPMELAGAVALWIWWQRRPRLASPNKEQSI
jgi:hypothetical protein